MNDSWQSSSPRRIIWVACVLGLALFVAFVWLATHGYRAVGSIDLEIRCDPSIPDDLRVSYGIVPKQFIEQTIEEHRQGHPTEHHFDEVIKTEPSSIFLTVCEVGVFGGSANRYPESDTMLVAFEYPDGHRDYQTVLIPWESTERPVQIVISLPKRDH